MDLVFQQCEIYWEWKVRQQETSGFVGNADYGDSCFLNNIITAISNLSWYLSSIFSLGKFLWTDKITEWVDSYHFTRKLDHFEWIEVSTWTLAFGPHSGVHSTWFRSARGQCLLVCMSQGERWEISPLQLCSSFLLSALWGNKGVDHVSLAFTAFCRSLNLLHFP